MNESETARRASSLANALFAAALLAKEAIDSAFAAELHDGRLVWRVVNIETKGNEHFAKDYKLYTKSVVLVNEVRGKPAQWENLEKVWQLLQDKPGFLRYVQQETRGYLTERS